jgi:polyhydroxybutyrate depolymerase
MVGLIAAAWSVALALPAAADRAPEAHTLEVGGLTRTYLLHVPPALPAGPAPLVLVFHGGGGNGPGTERLTRFNELADREGLLVAYPEGIGRNWYDGREFARGSRAHRERIDDVGFVAAMLDAIARAHAVDPTDPLVPYHGGAIAFGRGRIIDTEDAARRWARLNGAAPEPQPSPLPAPGKHHCGGLRLTYSGGRGGSEVVLVRLDGGGHTWPGGAQYLPERVVGRVCRDFDATALIWQFFRAHPKP